jgi:hypothetical protein
MNNDQSIRIYANRYTISIDIGKAPHRYNPIEAIGLIIDLARAIEMLGYGDENTNEIYKLARSARDMLTQDEIAALKPVDLEACQS